MVPVPGFEFQILVSKSSATPSFYAIHYVSKTIKHAKEFLSWYLSMGYPHNSIPCIVTWSLPKQLVRAKIEMATPHGAPDIWSAFYFSLIQIKESCTEINSLWGYANLFGCFEVLVMKNRVKQLTLLTFYKNLKNRRKLDFCVT